MDLYNVIINNQTFKHHLKAIYRAEDTRPFCRHGLEHLLDVARIAMLINVERELSLSKELIYTTALLHDLGRSKEYEDGTPHDIAGVELARLILSQCDATQDVMEPVLMAIGNHRGQDDSYSDANTMEATLAALIKEADVLSRPCFNCDAEPDCKWSHDKKNWEISY